MPSSFTVTCILRWASRKDNGATCPQCKAGFTHVVTHRKPSGTLIDFPEAVAVADLLDSCWFAYHKRVRRTCIAHCCTLLHNAPQQLDKGKAPVPDAYAEHEFYDEYDYDYDEDQEVEDFFMSSAAGRARIVLGNRRFGDGGYVSSGRRNARPVPQHTKVRQCNVHSSFRGCTHVLHRQAAKSLPRVRRLETSTKEGTSRPWARARGEVPRGARRVHHPALGAVHGAMRAARRWMSCTASADWFVS